MTGAAITITLLGGAPLPPAMVAAIQSVRVERATDLAGTFSLRFGISPTTIGDWTILDVDLFRPMLPVTIRLQVGTGLPEALLNGYVATSEATWAEGGAARLEVAGTDITGVMNLEEKSAAWPNQPDSVIAAAIFGQYGLIPRVDPTSPRIVSTEGSTMQRGSDIRFLQRLARRNGFDCYVQPEPISGLDQGFFAAPTLTGMPQAVLNVAMGTATNVGDLRCRYDMARPTVVTSAGLDTRTKAPQVGLAPVSTRPPMGVEPTTVRLLAGGRTAMVRPADAGSFSSADLQTDAQAIADRAAMAVTIEGRCGADVGILSPGALVALRGAGRLFNGLYLLRRVTIEIEDGDVSQRFTAVRNAVGMTGAEPYVSL